LDVKNDMILLGTRAGEMYEYKLGSAIPATPLITTHFDGECNY